MTSLTMTLPNVNAPARRPSSHLQFLVEDLAALAWDITKALASSPADVREFHELPNAGQAVFRTHAERFVASLDPQGNNRAMSRAIKFALLANDVLSNPELTPAIEMVAEQCAGDAIAAMPAELSRVWREGL